jgi:hypothetical protein
MAEKAKPEKVTLLLDPPFFEVLKAAVYKRPGRGKISALIREKLASDPELRAIADEMGIDLDSFVVKPLGGYRGDKSTLPEIEPTKGKVKQDSEIGQDRPIVAKADSESIGLRPDEIIRQRKLASSGKGLLGNGRR